jgi:hypothetical protein
MGVWEVVAKVGGISNIFTILFAYFFNKYSLINFKIYAINEFFEVKSHDIEADNVHKEFFVSHWNKFKLMVNLCPNKKVQRFIQKGERKLKTEFNYIKIIKDIKKLQ